MMFNSFVSLLALSGAVSVSAWGTPSGKNAWSVKQFKNFITFGDSYTDESRLGYFINSKGKAPPPGTYLPESLTTATGGRSWPRLVVQYTGSNGRDGKFNPGLTLYNYAVSGAVVSNLQTPRLFPPVNGYFPDIELYEVPAYLADKKFVNATTKKPYFQPAVDSRNTVAAFFIGTNDFGVYVEDGQRPGSTPVNYLNTLYAQVDKVYASGVRYFTLFNLFPLELAPIYANASFGGGKPDQYWPLRPSNITAISLKMTELVTTVNENYRTRTPYEVLLQRRYPGAQFANFDIYSWAINVYNNPTKYFNGTVSPNVKGTVHSCADQNCTTFTTNPSPDSFFWYDSLHPSEQTSRLLAMEYVRVLGGTSKYAKYYSG